MTSKRLTATTRTTIHETLVTQTRRTTTQHQKIMRKDKKK